MRNEFLIEFTDDTEHRYSLEYRVELGQHEQAIVRALLTDLTTEEAQSDDVIWDRDTAGICRPFPSARDPHGVGWDAAAFAARLAYEKAKDSAKAFGKTILN
jgi:hypothetical protein